MCTIEQFDSLMLELGHILQPLAIQKRSPGNFRVVMDREVAVELEFRERSHRLTFSSQLGKSPKESQTKIYEQLLRYNFLWNMTGGVILSLDDSNENVVQSFDLFAWNLNVSDLCLVLQNFTKKCRTWRKIFAEMIATRPKSENESYHEPTCPVGGYWKV